MINLSRIFIFRPVATTLLAIGLGFAGIVAFNFLPVASLPKIDFPTISVQASLPGASPEIMASSVATPLEKQIGRIAGVTELTSSSTLGSTRITIQFDLSRDIDGAARDVQAAINAARSQLPPDLPSNPTYRKVNPAEAPIMVMALTSDIHTRSQLYDAASSILSQKLAQVDGVGQVVVGGGSLPAIRIELNPNTLSKYGLGLEEVRETIASTNINRPKGHFISGEKQSYILTNDQMFKKEDYLPVILNVQNNTVVRISDVAEVVEAPEDLRNIGMADGKPSIVLVIFKQPGSNIIETVDRVESLIPALKSSIPSAMNLTVVLDRTTTIRASLHEVEGTLILATFLVILVVYLFLGNLRSTLIPSVAVPLSLLGTFGVMYLLDYSLDNLSLMALTIVTGFVVDDAVVVLENIMRHVEEGIKPMRAALKGAREVGFTVLSMSTSLVAVFIPILFMGGIVGRLFREFAVTLSIAIMMSLFVSLTVTPMMCAMTLKKTKKREYGKHFSDFVFSLRHRYEKSLNWALSHSFFMILLTLATLIFTIYLYIVIPKGFFPQQDTGRLVAQIQTDQNMSFQAIEQKFYQIVDIVRQDPAVLHSTGYVGGNASTGGNAGSMYISLTPLHERKITADQVIARLREKLKNIVGATLLMQAAQDLVVGGRLGNAQFQYTVTAETLEELNQNAPNIMNEIQKIPGVIDVNSDQRSRGLQAYVHIDYDTALRFGLTNHQVDQTLYDAFGQRQVSTLYTPMNQYHVVMEVASQYWQNPETLNDIYVKSPAGQLVPFNAFAHYSTGHTLLTVNHHGQFPSATISFNLLEGISLGDIVDNVSLRVQNMALPNSIHGSFQGTAQAFQESLSNEPYLILTALLAVYIVLGILYESLIHPITILSTLPSAGVGALFALILTGTDLTIIALIGIILLIGIVKKNAIMMIDFALHAERMEKKSTKDAILQGAVLRFRPIMMTTAAALLSAAPLAFGTGVGSELRRPLGIAIMGGLLFSQMLTLYTTPVIYLYLDQLSLWWKSRWQERFRLSSSGDEKVYVP